MKSLAPGSGGSEEGEPALANGKEMDHVFDRIRSKRKILLHRGPSIFSVLHRFIMYGVEVGIQTCPERWAQRPLLGNA